MSRAGFAALADKDVHGVASALVAQVDAWYLAGLQGARGQDAAMLATRLGDVLTPAAQADSVADALQRAITDAGDGDRILVFGSFHTVADALQALRSSD